MRGDADALATAVHRWNIRWAIVPNDSKQLITLLDRSPDWRRVKQDDVGAIYVRTGT